MTVSRLQPYATTVFAEMSALAARVGAVNLGQGFPDEDGPPAMLKAAQDAIAEGVNQYPPGIGVAALREAVAAQRKRHFGVDYDPDTEVLVTVGATEAIAAAVIGLIEPGSEVILIQPFYDSYSPVVAMAGAKRVIVPLVPDGHGFALDTDALRRAVTPRTKALIVNSPHNPTGTVLSAAELTAIAQVAVAVSSAALSTVPVGLCGEFTINALVRGVTARRKASVSSAKPWPSGTSGTMTRFAPAIATTGE